jgi:hypothetical protein
VEEEDGNNDASDSGLRPPFIRAAGYDTMVSRACFLDIMVLKRIAGTSEMLVVVDDDVSSPCRPIGAHTTTDVDTMFVDGEGARVGEKRPRAAFADLVGLKSVKRACGTVLCLAPPENVAVWRILDDEEQRLGSGDIGQQRLQEATFHLLRNKASNEAILSSFILSAFGKAPQGRAILMVVRA